MARQWRIEYEGAIYHVLSRGNARNDIFTDDEDRILFLEILEKMAGRFEIDVFAYVLMDNHYHLLLKTTKPNISKAMQWFGTTYTRRFNLKNHRSGHLFQGRFRNFLVENEKYLVRLSCYIHRNPLRAGIVKRLADYKWSSYPVYACGKTSPAWLRQDVITSRFSGKDKTSLYREMVQNYSHEEKKIWKDFRHGLFFGTPKFIERIKSKYFPNKEKNDLELPQKKRVLKENPKILLQKTALTLGCDPEDFLHKTRIGASAKDNRDLLIYVLWNTGWYNNREIGDLFGLGFSSVSRRVSIIKSKISMESGIRKKAKTLNALIKE